MTPKFEQKLIYYICYVFKSGIYMYHYLNTILYNYLDIFYYKILFIQLEVIIICFSLSPQNFQITKNKPPMIIQNLCCLSSNIRKIRFDTYLLLTHYIEFHLCFLRASLVILECRSLQEYSI